MITLDNLIQRKKQEKINLNLICDYWDEYCDGEWYLSESNLKTIKIFLRKLSLEEIINCCWKTIRRKVGDE